MLLWRYFIDITQVCNQLTRSKRSTLNIHWKDWCWSWGSNTLATWCEVPTHWKRFWCWERLRAGGEEGTEDEMVEWHHNSTDVSLSKLWEVKDREAWRAAVHGVMKTQTRLSDWTTTARRITPDNLGGPGSLSWKALRAVKASPRKKKIYLWAEASPCACKLLQFFPVLGSADFRLKSFTPFQGAPSKTQIWCFLSSILRPSYHSHGQGRQDPCRKDWILWLTGLRKLGKLHIGD